ncbi:MAG: 16S rRNA (adenine(1518)-N(6)/adenine(1519)-N(6))-dimethyltransferase RsmA [Gammaproteobacteria bacterium]
MRARKRFGQHFLHDPGVLHKIVRAISPGPADHVVEIGPGRGALTHALLEEWAGIVDGGEGATLDLIELDRDLVPRLREQLADNPRITIHEADALDFDFAKLASERGGRLRVVGNLPYNISTPLLFHLLGSANAIDDMHVMLQREVVERIAAAPGSGDYGRLTVMLAPWVRAESLFDVGPGAFQPPPKVWSAVVRLGVRREPAFTVSPHFAAVVSAAFSHRRKTIRNALRNLVTPERIAACGVDLGVRPETLSPDSFNKLAHTLDSDVPQTPVAGSQT